MKDIRGFLHEGYQGRGDWSRGGRCRLCTANAAPVEYVKICSLYGAGWFYIPGTDTCIHTANGETRVQTELGTKVDQSDLSNRVSATEGGVEEAQAEIDATNADLAKTNKQVNKQQKQIDDLQQSQDDLEQRFDNAFDELLDGIAVAMALAGPDLVAGERFAMKFNLGSYSGHNAFGFSASAVLARTDLGRVTRIRRRRHNGPEHRRERGRPAILVRAQDRSAPLTITAHWA